MRQASKTIMQFFLIIFIMLGAVSLGHTAEIDDSTVFVEAFNAYKQKDYLHALEKCEQLNRVFPDSPLRDVTLLLIARSSLKAGDNERAAKSTVLFSTEFPESSLKTSIEEELKVLAQRQQKGEILAADKTLQGAARKVSSDRVARERAAELKIEMDRVAKAKAEQERLALIKQDEERKEKERLQAEKLAKASIKVALSLRQPTESIPVGTYGNLPLEITNEGKISEEFILTISVAKGYDAVLTKADKRDENISRIKLSAGEKFTGSLSFKMPAEMVDGHRSALGIKAVSTRFSDVSFQKETVVISSAPLVRVVAKLAKQKVTPGEVLRYRVAVINAGSTSAKDLTVRLQLPPEIVSLESLNSAFKLEQNGMLAFKIDQVDMGKLVEMNLDVKIRDDSKTGRELRGHIEVFNNGLQIKERFETSTSVVEQIK